MLKRKITAMFLFLFMIVLLTGCASENGNAFHDDKTTIVCTSFPLYDWTSQLAQGTDAEVILLLDNGMDMHSFQPSAEDLIRIADCDLLVHVGGESDAWLMEALESQPNENRVVVNLMDTLKAYLLEETFTEGMEGCHVHSDGEEHTEECQGTEGYVPEETYDEHLWLSLRLASVCCEEIGNALCKVLPDKAEMIGANTETYRQELKKLDEEYVAMTETVAKKLIVVGDRFPFLYLTEDYGIEYYAAFPGCSTESEADFETVIFLAEKVDEHDVNTVFITEGGTMDLANAIISNTKDKDQHVGILHSMQAVFQSDIDNGASYLGYMEENLEALRLAMEGYGE